MTSNEKSVKDMTWEDHQVWEQQWHGLCLNTFGEEVKQITYAHRMGLVIVPNEGKWPTYDLDGMSVLDIGGGPSSMLLKTINGSRMTVVDPCKYPDWVYDRYQSAGINHISVKGEDFVLFHDEPLYDECWIYNVLQHTDQPSKIIQAARKSAKVVRIFEWVDTSAEKGHPHTLRRHFLDEWFGGNGVVEEMSGENGCWGRAYYGVFK